jgi:protoporphyrinogen oxidase
MKVGIIGGGMMGLATAFYLSRSGAAVTVLEKENEVGGLSRWDEILPGIRWDRFYHVILTTDTELLEFIDEIGLSMDVEFRETRTGFFIDGRMHSMSSAWEFLTFKPLSLLDKFRLGLGLLYVNGVSDWKRLERIYVKEWLVKVFGRRNYEKMWDPLLRAKLGEARKETSAAFIWATIKRLYGTRQKGAKREMMGCVRGGYHSILTHLRRRLEKEGAIIRTQWLVSSVAANNGGISLTRDNGESLFFDKVIATVPNPVIGQMLTDPPAELKTRLDAVQYLGVVCMTLVLKRSLSPFYVTNLIDPALPFTGLIEASHVVPPKILGGKTLVYLPRYFTPQDPYASLSDKAVTDAFVGALKKMFPDFTETDILFCRINRERYVQPVYSIRYSESIPPIKTQIENFYMVNTSMILNSTLNNNQVVQLANRAKITLIEKSCAPEKK